MPLTTHISGNASVSNSVLLVEPKQVEKVEPKLRRERARR